MAARKTLLELDQHWRNKIRTTAIINRLNSHIGGGKTAAKMTSTQVMAARILLAKVLPDLVSTELTGKGGGPIQTQSVDDEITRRLLSGIAPGGTPQAPVEAEPDGSAETAVRVALLGETKPARTNGHR